MGKYHISLLRFRYALVSLVSTNHISFREAWAASDEYIDRFKLARFYIPNVSQMYDVREVLFGLASRVRIELGRVVGSDIPTQSIHRYASAFDTSEDGEYVDFFHMW